MKTTAQLKNVRISPTKAREVAMSLRGIDVMTALVQMQHETRRAGAIMAKLLESAIANAQNNSGLDKNNLYVYDVQIGEGPRLKRWMPRAFGRATPIIKRMARITVILEEREEGKNRLSPKELKHKKETVHPHDGEHANPSTLRAADGTVTVEAEKGARDHKKEHRTAESERKQSRQGGWTKKLFQRKAQ